MKSEYTNMLRAYTKLEGEVREYISSLFSGTCMLCTSSCCTPDICEESLDSVFLKSVRAVYEPGALFCDSYGWLTERGCALKCGRPPVCYGFFCNEIVNSLSKRDHDAIMVLGRLLSWVGEKAFRGMHLVEIMDENELNSLKTERILKRLSIASLALDGVKNAIQNISVESGQLDAIRQISAKYLNG